MKWERVTSSQDIVFACSEIMRASQKREIASWCETNLGLRGRDWMLRGDRVVIKDHGHAALFTLRFCGVMTEIED